ncbi:hypothetical protein [Nocardia sp. alder85J]|uniref:hypothetical protein n=1 Tax=Nocardia sp. alder85J TaxID=2862949 RepID=UPI001CD40238|nr:hypothetical protein [Nocardia sp. alder85J]MCX4093615.1 hypothetical protein [Nocardia sp. alder85J]
MLNDQCWLQSFVGGDGEQDQRESAAESDATGADGSGEGSAVGVGEQSGGKCDNGRGQDSGGERGCCMIG